MTKTTAKYEAKKKALATYLGVDKSEIELISGEGLFQVGSAEYLVLTDSEAQLSAEAVIKNTLWAFNARFLIKFIDAPKYVDGRGAEASIQLVQKKLCEDANFMIRALVGDRLSKLIKEAIQSDGRGHFLSSYDGKENVQDKFFIYRQN